MTPLYGYDGASAFDLTVAAARNGILASCYIVGSPGGFKHADATRVAAVRKAGLGALPNWERTAGFFLTCTVADAKAAGVEALAAARDCGFPDDGSIRLPFSFDAQIPSSRYAEMGDKIHACGVGLAGAFQPMLYAQSGLIDYVAHHGQAPGKHWLMASTWGQAYDPTSPNVCMVQSHDAAGNWINSPVPGTDINTVTDPYAVGAWWPDGSPYGGTMPLSDADIANIWAHPILADNQSPPVNWQAQHMLQRAYTEADAAGTLAKSATDGVAALKAEVAQLQAALATVQQTITTGGVDPVALAKAIADHIDLAAK